jgi:hypothetical protein
MHLRKSKQITGKYVCSFLRKEDRPSKHDDKQAPKTSHQFRFEALRVNKQPTKCRELLTGTLYRWQQKLE